MIPEEAIIELRDASDNEVRYGDTEHHYNEVMKRIEALDMAIKALEQQPCEDCISRQAVLDALASIAKAKARSDAQKSLIGRVIFFTEQLLSVTPTRPTGKWKRIHPQGIYECSECGINLMTEDIECYEYCHGCGARMTESEEEE